MTATALLNAVSAQVLRRLDPELAHDLAIKAMAFGLVPSAPAPVDPRLRVQRLGLDFPHPIGLAAGFDKNGEAADSLLAIGFSHVEVGTVTPLPQPGNPKPRLFRLPESQALINRFGFNSAGHDALARQLARRSGRPGIVGVNIGANKTSTDRAADYAAGIARFSPSASYFAVNVSSPNTPGLRDLQARDGLDEVLARVAEARDDTTATTGRRVPVLLKIAPDMGEAGLDDICTVALARAVDGLIVSNTTLSRAGVAGPVAAESGGLSGQPLFERSTIVLAKVRQRVGAAMTLIGVGGVATADQAFEKIAAGADLVQIYSAFIFADAAIAGTLVKGLADRLTRDGLPSIGAARDSALARWADRPIPD